MNYIVVIIKPGKFASEDSLHATLASAISRGEYINKISARGFALTTTKEHWDVIKHKYRVSIKITS